jgi:hypothetical protein
MTRERLAAIAAGTVLGLGVACGLLWVLGAALRALGLL